ncbi:ABC transporter substrate-binding protein [Alkalihalobacillus alcalophilus ATCC 27647 = CGMCC 1.3604]|uniref:ABC transporter substrate-binding protein n=1 Tax=Alkalihalobacillus alcalophilus ATCC 27647 = CGMCC 1.3604 TaxID=1218173 RepID=A0A094WL70_ALKAL|nr:extracellular solute-binding protein [Alkalihalobacillus alcalophilus]KGA98499.1 ABC transporter substrate-binding protein [Alkalihalobacillus alcalophilus ATCC 27647 = CGMCC 1.3604]MED1563733.1 extracellular solute-binding protein [Alkalihalobacillus alcalophilus]THG91039.1 ABC transporter substrate-binding protein [Alkalihalobacillus alcalophilus ATCC 27647 = CGMCC 1.3604]
MSKLNRLMMLLLFSFLLVGCGGNDEFTIEFWTPLTGDDGANMDQIVKEYNETEPEYKVNHVITSDMYTKMYTVLNSGRGIPDLSIIHADRVPNFVDQNLLEPMTEIMAIEPELKEENYLTEAWTSGNVDGTQYTIPLDIHGSAMYYNKELLAKYNVEHFLDDNVVTFEEILSLQGQLDEGDYVVNDALLSWVIFAQIQNLGGDIQDENGNPAVNTPEMKQAIEAIKEIKDAGLMTPYGEDGYLMFQSGNVLFSTDGTWSSIGHAQVESLDFGVTNVYAFEPEIFHNRASSHLFAMLTSDERTDEKEEGIARFLEYLRANSMEWAEAGQIVASIDVIEDSNYDSYLQSFFTSTEEQTDSLYIYTYRHYPYIAEALDTYSADMVHGELDIDQGLEEMQRFVEDKVSEGALDLENVINEEEENDN